MKQEQIPETIIEAVDYLLAEFKKSEVGTDTNVHLSYGMTIRNSWCLWWSEKGAKKYDAWSDEPSDLIKEFIKLGIFHGDDRSGFLLALVKAKDNNLNLRDAAYSERNKYITHWYNYDKRMDLTDMTEEELKMSLYVWAEKFNTEYPIELN